MARFPAVSVTAEIGDVARNWYKDSRQFHLMMMQTTATSSLQLVRFSRIMKPVLSGAEEHIALWITLLIIETLGGTDFSPGDATTEVEALNQVPSINRTALFRPTERSYNLCLLLGVSSITHSYSRNGRKRTTSFTLQRYRGQDFALPPFHLAQRSRLTGIPECT